MAGRSKGLNSYQVLTLPPTGIPLNDEKSRQEGVTNSERSALPDPLLVLAGLPDRALWWDCQGAGDGRPFTFPHESSKGNNRLHGAAKALSCAPALCLWAAPRLRDSKPARTQTTRLHRRQKPVCCDNLEGWGGEGGGRGYRIEGTNVCLWLIHIDGWQEPPLCCNYPPIKINK